MLNQPKFPAKSTKTSQDSGGRYLTRQSILDILDAALQAKEFHFAHQLAQKWLALYPGDLQASLLYGKALFGDGRIAESLTVLRGLSQVDPENSEIIAALLKVEVNDHRNSPSLAHTPPKLSDRLSKTNNWLVALTGRSTGKTVANNPEEAYIEWGERLYTIRKEIQAGNLEAAGESIPNLLGANINSPLVPVTHLRLLQADPDSPLSARRTLAEFYHQQWPDCLPISLWLAEWLVREGETDRAISLLHQSAARDIGGSVPITLWGDEHPYRSLWPETPGMFLETQLPASVTALLGWNQLQPGSTSSDAESISSPEESSLDENSTDGNSTDESIGSTYGIKKAPDEQIILMKSELDRLALGLNQLPVSAVDGRFPVYVIFSSYNNLVRQYGEQSTLELLQEMKNLAYTLNNKSNKKTSVRERWGSAVFLPDMAESTASLGVSAPRALDPWSLKLSLIDLDAALEKRGEMIGALLIVGGPEIIPFHNLPNPVDDPDQEVPSDNPYATRDENYFIPEWPVGRLPGGATNDPWLILQSLRRIRQVHASTVKMPSSTRYLFNRLTSWLRPSEPRRGFGYTAAIWRPASMHVFKPVGESRAVLVSPPAGLNGKNPALATPNGKPLVPLPNAYLGYFNLHGLPDAAEWYGQKDPLSTTDRQGRPLPDYPIALRPVDVQTLGEKTPRIVFSEACYGALINNKNVDQALALKFLAHGTQAFAGSSSMAYGSVNAPLIAADLLGYTFWQGLMQGYTAGQAFQRAKIHLANEMHQRQGYLDGEDQKSLISFVLYGDPLARLSDHIRHSKSFPRSSSKPLLVKTVCDRSTGECHEEIDLAQLDQAPEALPPDVMSHVKKIVTRYLPGMEDSHLTYSVEHSLCQSDDHNCPTSQSNGKNHPGVQPDRRLVILRKEIKITRENGEQVHQRYARLTLDPQGRLVKMAVSR